MTKKTKKCIAKLYIKFNNDSTKFNKKSKDFETYLRTLFQV